jgi:putative flippase GtrA
MTAMAPTRGLRQPVTFAVIGVFSTIAYILIYTATRSAASAQYANAVALALTTVANTQANRRITFGIRGSRGLAADHLAGLAAFGVALAITSGSLGLLLLTVPHPGVAIELTVVVLGNALATLSRFVLLRWWMTRHQRFTLVRSTGSSAAAQATKPPITSVTSSNPRS